MNSPDTMAEATKWLVELQTADRLDDIWDEFDDWFQASAAHRDAYAKVRGHWLKLTGLPAVPTRKSEYRGAIHRSVSVFLTRAFAWMAHWELVLAVLLVLMLTCSAEFYQPDFDALWPIL